jgi:hypothetical protein
MNARFLIEIYGAPKYGAEALTNLSASRLSRNLNNFIE